MESRFAARPPQPGLQFARLHQAAGPIRLAPVPEHRLLVVASAETWSACRESGRRFLRRRGQIDIVPAGAEGGFDAESACDLLELRLPASLIEDVSEAVGPPVTRPTLPYRHMLEDERIASLAWALDHDAGSAMPAGRLFVDGIAIAIAARLAGLAETRPLPPRGLSAMQLRRLFDYIEAHLDRPLALDRLARIAGASSAHLRHWFKAQTGMTVHRYVVRRRVERARMLLLQSGMTMAEAALAAGFAHQSHMARWMRRELGCTPAQLRRGDGPMAARA